MKTLEIKTVTQLAEHYNSGNLWGWTKINNLDREGSEMYNARQKFHADAFENCSRGTQIALINEFIFDGGRYRLGRSGFTRPECAEMLDAYLSDKK